MTGVMAAAAMSLATGAWAQEAAGEWHGSMTTQGVTLRVGVSIAAKKGGGYEGSISSPDQGPGIIPMDEIKSQAGALSFSIAMIGGSYDGKWDAAQKAWTGTWMQNGVTLPLVLTAGPPR
jgi:hypothetical protein